MPIDFERIPPKVEVPALSRPSAIVWIPLLCAALCIGVTITILRWTEGNPTNSSWFWLCAVGYPVLGWGLAFASSLAYERMTLKSAHAQNKISEQAEQACHDAASRPLAIFGYGWRFSSDEAENSLQSVLDETVQSELRPSGAVPDKEVHARWIDIPGTPFYPGNELGEHTRHLVVCEWLISRLLNDLSTPLRALPASTLLHIHLCLSSRLKPEPVVEQLRRALKDRRAPNNLRIDLEENLSIFATDPWLDAQDEKTVHLVIAIQLRDAISTMLDGGVAEAGVALLIGDPRLFRQRSGEALHLHRPTSGAMNAAKEVIELASRWGRSNARSLHAIWTQGFSADGLAGVRGGANLDAALPLRQIEASVGDCSGAGAWLAIALAAASAESDAKPQLVLCTRDDELIALVCRKEK